jgi:hypothetical protein
MTLITSLLNRIRRREPSLKDAIESNNVCASPVSGDSIIRNFNKIITDVVKDNIGTVYIQKFEEYGSIFTQYCNGYKLYSKYGVDFIDDLIAYVTDVSNNFKENIQYQNNNASFTIKPVLIADDQQCHEVQLTLIAHHINRPLIHMGRLGFNDKEVSSLLDNAIQPGLTLIAGPASSGRSTTLYYLLLSIMKEFKDKRFVYIDKDSRFEIPEITSVKRYDADRLDRILASNPDVIGIVDVNSQAEIEFIHKASMMGIRVIATLKCVSPISVFYRMSNLGLTHHQLMAQDFIKTIVFQDLCRKLCDACAIPLHQDGQNTHERRHNSEGCSTCHASGWNGQHLLVEVLHYPYIQKLFTNTLNKEGMGINHNFSNENASILKDKACMAIEDGVCDRKDVSWHLKIPK